MNRHGLRVPCANIGTPSLSPNGYENATLYVWHTTADEIRDSLAAYCQRISDSGHLPLLHIRPERGRPIPAPFYSSAEG